MPRNFQPMDLREKVPKGARKLSSLWKNPIIGCFQKREIAGSDTQNEIRSFQNAFALELPRSSSVSTENLKSQKGFVQVFLISLLPILLAGFLVILFSQYYLKNWMESVHICRVELLTSQKKTAGHLKRLMDFNPVAQALRTALVAAEIEFAVALATENFAAMAIAQQKIQNIKRQQRALDKIQKAIIAQANFQMARGVEAVSRKIKQQSAALQAKLPEYFSFRIYQIRVFPTRLAVKPDRPDIAPVYGLQRNFEDRQSLHVSWTSEFRTRNNGSQKWIKNHHKKQDGCSASLKPEGKNFQEVLHAGKSSWRL